jgi:hypothetical protein
VHIFSEKFIILKGKVATTPFTTPIQVLLNIIKGLKGQKKDRRTILISCLVWLPLLIKVATG